MKLFVISLYFVAGLSTAYACVPSQSVLEYRNAVTCHNQSGTKKVDFRFKTASQVMVKIKNITELCAKSGTKYQLSWITFNESGAVIKEVPFTDEIQNWPGKKQALRIKITDPEKCGYFMLEFDADFE